MVLNDPGLTLTNLLGEDVKGASWMVQQVKNPLGMQEMQERGLIPGSGRSLEEGMATHSRILAGKIPWTEEPGGLQSMGSQRVRHDSSS